MKFNPSLFRVDIAETTGPLMLGWFESSLLEGCYKFLHAFSKPESCIAEAASTSAVPKLIQRFGITVTFISRSYAAVSIR